MAVEDLPAFPRFLKAVNTLVAAKEGQRNASPSEKAAWALDVKKAQEEYDTAAKAVGL